jgi:perosamine synthetase
MIPSVGTPIGCKDILNGFFSRESLDRFTETTAEHMKRRHVLLANSGTTAYFIILKALQRLSKKREVILPAYTAPSLILPIKKAGLVPRLCDIDLKTFNMDLRALPAVVTNDTLAVTIVHMFGLPQWFESASQEHGLSKSTFIIEDLASAQGSTVYGRTVGSFGDVSFVSFNRGKNFATLSGGAIATDREDISRLASEEGERYLTEPSLRAKIGIIVKAIALSLAGVLLRSLSIKVSTTTSLCMRIPGFRQVWVTRPFKKPASFLEKGSRTDSTSTVHSHGSRALPYLLFQMDPYRFLISFPFSLMIRPGGISS